MNAVVYAVKGGYEDYAYASSWDKGYNAHTCMSAVPGLGAAYAEYPADRYNNPPDGGVCWRVGAKVGVD